jgi:nitrogen fixation protein NifU and related proteins
VLDRQAYIEFLLDHYQNPRHRGRIEDADVTVTGNNPSCGDIVTLYIKQGDGERLDSVHFEGEGCTISMAGASIVSELADEKSIDELLAMDVDDIVELMGKDVVVSRVRCATIGIGTLKAGIEELRAKQHADH